MVGEKFWNMGVIYDKQKFFSYLVRRIKIVSLRWKLVPNSNYVEFDGDAHLSCFGPEVSLFEQIWYKKLKLSI